MDWEFRLFGPIQARATGAATAVELSPLPASLLAFLLLNHQQRVTRQAAIEVFWSDQPEARARRSLATALWRLRRAFEEHGAGDPSPLQAGITSLRLVGGYWLDVAEFERAARLATSVRVEEASDGLARQLDDALKLYRGELLGSVTDDWAVDERARFELMRQECLAYLMRYASLHGDTDSGLHYGALLLRSDPLREDIHREMMRLYVRTGQRAMAVRQYEACRNALAAELGIAPMEETRRVLQWATDASDPTPLQRSPSLEDLTEMLQTALRAQQALQVVIDELSRRTLPPVVAPESALAHFEHRPAV